MPESSPKLSLKGTPAKRGRKVGSGKFKATKFDKDLVKLIQSGVTRFTDWCQALGVDETQARFRVNALVEKGYLAPDAQLVGVYRLGIEGYNKYGSIKKALPVVSSTPPAVTPELASQKPVSERKEKTAGLQASLPLAVRTVPVSTAPRHFDDSGALTQEIPKARTEVDLAELIQRGSPAKLRKADGNMCELCRGEFKYSLKEPKLAKFAHCSCGSAYHEDCYNSLVESGNGCARCGRKLSAVLDPGSQDALKFVKDAFE